MANFVAIKNMNYNTQEDILNALDFIKSKIPKKEIVPNFFSWYGNLIAIVQGNDLYDIIGMSAEYLEEQRIFIEKFEVTFAEKFLAVASRKQISHTKSKFKKGCILVNEYELFLGNTETIREITDIFSIFSEYAGFINNLYDPIFLKLNEHLAKEGTELTSFIDITKIKGRVNYEPMIGEVKLNKIPFVKELNECQATLQAIEKWIMLVPFETNIPTANEEYGDNWSQLAPATNNEDGGIAITIVEITTE